MVAAPVGGAHIAVCAAGVWGGALIAVGAGEAGGAGIDLVGVPNEILDGSVGV